MVERLTRRGFMVTSGAALAAPYVAGLSPAAAASALLSGALPDEDGSELWLRYRLVDQPNLLTMYRRAFTQVVRHGDAVVLRSAEDELTRGLSEMLGRNVSAVQAPTKDGAVILGTPDTSPVIRDQIPADELADLGPEGYVLRRKQVDGSAVVLIASVGPRGVLYGAFHLLRMLQTRSRVDTLDVAERPVNALRLANHWDNLDRTVERGYAGESIFHWDKLPEIQPHYATYARALAAVGMNGTVVNNVNANAEFLSSEMIQNLAPLAEILQAWGLTFYLSANFASPMTLGGLTTADPMDPAVRDWWRDKVDEIYGHIPSFGGFLVKANSEGQPGPLDYGRTHADGANMFAEMLEPHGGIVMWRAFIWSGAETWSDEAYKTFHALDGEFADNALVQVKNGPIDFQVREPVHPLFGGLPNTNTMLELQITQEYTGHTTHLCYLVPQWKEVYSFDTHAEGPGTTVTDIVSGETYGYTHSGTAGVMNFGSDTNWTRHHLAAANTHGYGRLAWNPNLDAEVIADEWVRMTFGSHPQVVRLLTRMLLSSWEIYESYNAPLGSGFIHGGGDHFNPCPVCEEPWHRSDAEGIGFDRTVATGTGTAGFYHPPVSEMFESAEDCPDELLLFFHHVPYTHRLHSGKTVIQHIYDSRFEGLEDVYLLRRLWEAQERQIDSRRHDEVLERFDRQVEHATLWRDTLVSYWFGKSRILDEQDRSWVQARFHPALRVLLDGLPNLMQFTVANATRGAMDITSSLEVPEGWTSGSTTTTLQSRDVVDVALPVRPSVGPPQTATLQVNLDAPEDDIMRTSASVMTAPAGQRCALAIDAGSGSSPLLPGYRRLTPSDAWDPDRGYGWVGSAPQSRDRGGVDPLLRDFVNDVEPRTLRVAVPAGSYDTYLLVGDFGASSKQTFIHADGELIAESEFLYTGEFGWVHFTLDGGADGREIDLELSGVPDEHWHLGALVLVDPAAEIPRIVVTDVSGGLLMLGGRDHPVTVQVANTTEAEDVPVTANVVVPDGWSAEEASGVAPAGEFAELEPSVRPAPGPVITTIQIDVSADGQEDESRVVPVVAVPAGDDVALALDVGHRFSPVLDTYQQLAPEHAWDPAQGYGWVGDGPQSRDRGGPDVLRRDFTNDSQPRTLRLAVPAGQHDVYVLVGDTLASHPTYIRVGGELVAQTEALAAGEFVWLQFTLDGGASGREADLELSSDPGEHWHLNAVIIR